MRTVRIVCSDSNEDPKLIIVNYSDFSKGQRVRLSYAEWDWQASAAFR